MIDIVVFRGADAVGGWLFAALRGAGLEIRDDLARDSAGRGRLARARARTRARAGSAARESRGSP